jgi:hypothetical protein
VGAKVIQKSKRKMQNFNSKNKKIVIISAVIIVILLVVLFIQQVVMLRKAHSTFENYYAFRGCVQLLATTTDSGTCRTGGGQVIKIVLYNGKWYLDGDLPQCLVPLPRGNCLLNMP